MKNNNFPQEFFSEDILNRKMIRVKKIQIRSPNKKEFNTQNQQNDYKLAIEKTPSFKKEAKKQFVIPKLDLLKINNNQEFKKTFNKINKKSPNTNKQKEINFDYQLKANQQKTQNEILQNNYQLAFDRFPQDVFSAPCMSTRANDLPENAMNLYKKIKDIQMNFNMKRLYPKQLPPLKPVQHKKFKGANSQQMLQRRVSEPSNFQQENKDFNYTFSGKDSMNQPKDQFVNENRKGTKSVLRLRIPTQDKELESILEKGGKYSCRHLL